MDNYFAFFGVPVRFFPDETRIRDKFMQNDTRLQPDFHNMEDPEEQIENFDKANYNQEAYETVVDYDYRMEHILMLNEALDDNWDDPMDSSRYQFLEKWDNKLKGIAEEDLEDTIDAWVNQLDDLVYPLLEDHDKGVRTSALWKDIAEYFLTRQYLFSKID